MAAVYDTTFENLYQQSQLSKTTLSIFEVLLFLNKIKQFQSFLEKWYYQSNFTWIT